MAVDLTQLSPLVLGANTMPVMDVQFNPGEQQNPIRHSGNPFAGGLIVPSRNPTVTFTTFFASAWTALASFKLVRFTALEFFLRGYTNGVASGTGDKHSLKTGGQAFAHITGLSEGEGGLIMASIEVYCLSGGALNGIEDILERTAGATIPTVSAEPIYYKHGPASIGGNVVEGLTSFSLSTGNRNIPIAPTDGKTYAESIIYDGGERALSLGFDGARQVLQSITAAGVQIEATPTIVYFRRVDRKGVVLATSGSGVSLTIAKGRVTVGNFAGSVASQNTATMNIYAINESLNDTDPIAVSTSATVP
jgi:hypothetical protein